MILLQVGATYTDMQSLIAGLYNEMIPLASKLISVGTGLAGLGAVIYVFYTLWPVLAGREPLDIYPLMRPFALLLCLMFYMGIVDVMNAVLNPIVNATNGMVNYQNQVVINNIKRKQELIEQMNKKPPYVKKDAEEGWLSDVAEQIGALNEYFTAIPEVMETAARNLLSFILELMFYAAGLVVNAIRTFYLIVLVIIGPLALGFSLFPGFENTFSSWLARYVQIFMWLPISNILGTIISKFQTLMVEQDIERMVANGNYDGADMGYLIFLIFGICSYLTIPSVSGWIIESSGAGRALRETSSRSQKLGGALAAGGGNYMGSITRGYKGGLAGSMK